MPTLLIIDDEKNILYSLRKTLRSEALHVITAETAMEGLDLARTEKPDAVILDVRLPDMSGLDAFTQLHAADPRLPVIIITAYTTTETAIEAMKRGAYDYLLKPVELDRLKEVVGRALDISRMSHVRTLFGDEEAMQSETADMIVGRSETMQHVYKAIGRVAPQDVTVLIQGESGTGKELIARAIYHHSRRNEGPFLAINCAAIPDTLLESELFGYEKGAFTGADTRRVGKFEQVDGGTLFLDEIGDMSPATQAKILRLLQDGSFERVGGNQTIRSDVRVIAATHRNLEGMVAAEEFRHDLYYRLQVFSITVPPLRERLGDLPLLIQHFVKTHNREFNKHVRSVSDDALQALRAHPWPGNVRELQSAVKYAMVQAVGETITLDCLPPSCLQEAELLTFEGDNADQVPTFEVKQAARQLLVENDSDIYRKIHSDVDRVLLQQVLNHVDGNQAQAAQLLGISRSTLRAKISDLGLTFEKRVLSGADSEEDG